MRITTSGHTSSITSYTCDTLSKCMRPSLTCFPCRVCMGPALRISCTLSSSSKVTNLRERGEGEDVRGEDVRGEKGRT